MRVNPLSVSAQVDRSVFTLNQTLVNVREVNHNQVLSVHVSTIEIHEVIRLKCSFNVTAPKLSSLV